MCPCACVCPGSPRCLFTGACVFDSSFPVGFLRSPPSEWSRVRSAASSLARVFVDLPLFFCKGSSEDNTMPSILFLSTGEVGQFHLSRCPTSTQLNQHTRTNTYNAISNRGRRAGGAEPEAGAVETVDRGGEGGGGGGVFGHNLTRHYMRVSSKELSESLKAVRVRRCARLAGCAVCS